jgi:hypothetical protein
MYNTAVTWLSGATPPSSGAFCNLASGSSTVWHCDFTKSGTAYSMVWDNKFASAEQGQTNYCASTFSNAYVCGNTTYTVSSNFVDGEWVDLNPTTTYGLGATVTIGLNPILLVAP